MRSLPAIELVECSHQKLYSNCKYCGLYLSEVPAFKSNSYHLDGQILGNRYLKSLRTSSKRFKTIKQKFAYSDSIYSFLQKIVTKFQFSNETFSLGVYLFNLLIEKKSNSSNDYVAEMQFYASVCLIIAAKSLDLDKNIPYFSRYQRYAQKSHKKQQYEKTEAQILQEFEFNIQIPTFSTFLSFYLSNGILFQNDNYNKHRIFVLEQKVRQIEKTYIRTGCFVTEDQQKLASKVIYQARKQCNLRWNCMIQEYSKIPLSSFYQSQVLKPINIHHSFTILPSLNKTKPNERSIHINRSLKKSNSSTRNNFKGLRESKEEGPRSAQKHRLLKGACSLGSIPLINGLHFRSLNKI